MFFPVIVVVCLVGSQESSRLTTSAGMSLVAQTLTAMADLIWSFRQRRPIQAALQMQVQSTSTTTPLTSSIWRPTPIHYKAELQLISPSVGGLLWRRATSHTAW